MLSHSDPNISSATVVSNFDSHKMAMVRVILSLTIALILFNGNVSLNAFGHEFLVWNVLKLLKKIFAGCVAIWPPKWMTKEMKNEADTDENGKISKREFRKFLEKHDDNPDLDKILNGKASPWAYDEDHFKISITSDPAKILLYV